MKAFIDDRFVPITAVVGIFLTGFLGGILVFGTTHAQNVMIPNQAPKETFIDSLKTKIKTEREQTDDKYNELILTKLDDILLRLHEKDCTR